MVCCTPSPSREGGPPLSPEANCWVTCRLPPLTASLISRLLRIFSCPRPCRRVPDRMRGICTYARRQALRLPCSNGGPLGAPPQVRAVHPTCCFGTRKLWVPRRAGDLPCQRPAFWRRVAATYFGGRRSSPLFPCPAEANFECSRGRTGQKAGTRWNPDTLASVAGLASYPSVWATSMTFPIAAAIPR